MYREVISLGFHELVHGDHNNSEVQAGVAFHRKRDGGAHAVPARPASEARRKRVTAFVRARRLLRGAADLLRRRREVECI